ncbi:MAG: DUF1499 domain-containing protein [Gemmatimonadetes bacterium]|nr:DUF1499 domain-containing protein [Gemmatimonadota bacterium]MXX73274.1 DUF1499 domain-containing protein [Gemmatimonadota bacterium]MYB04920.1 DUF1499 domain-containing protein [Gemmatimonadota bacterium]MYC89995.1 DUF1499 domain-containing protein [Gemmatimonadota bacterium]MYG21428.1 DUF1499 domain-containing protein [Gemmatimonadota bacterium]
MSTCTRSAAGCSGSAMTSSSRLSPAEGVVHVQSVSRVGLFDFGVNRRRVERVRRRLRMRSGCGVTLGY